VVRRWRWGAGRGRERGAGRAASGVASRDDRGQVGGIEALPFGLLVFVVGSLLVANAWAVIDAKIAVDAAARQAARAYAEAELPAEAERDAVAAGLAALQAHGRNPDEASLALTRREGAGGQ
jgi:hypothetical protein